VKRKKHFSTDVILPFYCFFFINISTLPCQCAPGLNRHQQVPGWTVWSSGCSGGLLGCSGWLPKWAGGSGGLEKKSEEEVKEEEKGRGGSGVRRGKELDEETKKGESQKQEESQKEEKSQKEGSKKLLSHLLVESLEEFSERISDYQELEEESKEEEPQKKESKKLLSHSLLESLEEFSERLTGDDPLSKCDLEFGLNTKFTKVYQSSEEEETSWKDSADIKLKKLLERLLTDLFEVVDESPESSLESSEEICDLVFTVNTKVEGKLHMSSEEDDDFTKFARFSSEEN